jgi:hypothetical protein
MCAAKPPWPRLWPARALLWSSLGLALRAGDWPVTFLPQFSISASNTKSSSMYWCCLGKHTTRWYCLNSCGEVSQHHARMDNVLMCAIDGELKDVLEVVDVAEEEAVIWCMWRCGTMCCSGGVNDVAWDASASQDHLHRPGGLLKLCT